MILEGMVLGTITFAGFKMLFDKLPDKIKDFAIRHPLITDTCIVVVFYEVMGMSIVAHVAVACMSMMEFAYLGILRNPEEWGWILDYVEQGKQKIMQAIEGLKKYKPN